MRTDASIVDRAGELLHRHIGLRLEPSLRSRLARAVEDAAGLAGQDSSSFVDALGEDAAMLQSLCDRVTVQETGFFRHPEQFDVLADQLLPTLRPPVRIWSAACANGQEAYSLAMVLDETAIAGRVLATDVSLAAVRRTREAQYSERELAGLSARRQDAHGSRREGGWAVSPEIRARVDIGFRNLLEPLSAEIAGCQIVFCRNVLIYFTPAHATAFLDRLADQLAPGAHLFVGGTESVWHLSDRFDPVHFGRTFAYRVRGRTAARSDLSPRSRRAGLASDQSVTPRRDVALPSASVQPPARVPQDGTSRAASSGWTSVDELVRRGREAHRAGDHVAAAQAFRQWAYAEPEDPLAHFHLGVALEAAGDVHAATRSFDISRNLLVRGAVPASVAAFGGYGLDDVLRHLERKRAGMR